MHTVLLFLLFLLSLLGAPAHAASGPCYVQDTAGCSLSGPLTSPGLTNNGTAALNGAATVATSGGAIPLTVTTSNTAGGAIALNVNISASTTNSEALQVLEANLAAGSQIYIELGLSSSTNNAGVIGFTPNATANQSTLNLSLFGVNNIFQVRGDNVALFGGPAKLHGYTVATLPACTATIAGSLAYVTDQAATAPSYGGALTGGGSTAWPAFCNGSTWTAH